MSGQTQPKPPTRTVVKGSGDFVNEIFTNPDTGVVVNVNAYTRERLNTIKTTMQAQQAAQLASVNEMLALLTTV